tara:strand:+ start:25345 stop:27669 length:2325 start_codon:yes stop_codon:yes gene_type:complete
MLLVEGPVGHMAHPYENFDMTFRELIDMFKVASQGFPKLNVTEKLDGQNILISYDPKTGQALAVRAMKAHAALGGVNKEQLKDYFTVERERKKYEQLLKKGVSQAEAAAEAKAARLDATEQGAGVVEAFYDAMQNFEEAAKNLPRDIFISPQGNNIFYNGEVMDPRSPNVVDYDARVLTLHRTGLQELINDKLVPLESTQAEDRASQIEAELQNFQDDEDLPLITVNAIKDFTNFIENREAYQAAIRKLRLLGRPGETIGGFMRARVLNYLNERLNTYLTEETIDGMVDAILFVAKTNRNPRKTQEIARVMATIPQHETDSRGLAMDLLSTPKEIKNILRIAINPLEQVIHDFGVSVLNNMKSAYIVQSGVAVTRLKGKVSQHIQKVRKTASRADLEVLQRNIKKILGGEDVGDVLNDENLQAAIEKITTAVEGLVFDYNGQTYKFTGNFAPINQIMGLGRYSRGPETETPKLGESDIDVNEPITEEEYEIKQVVVIYPGRFQPMGRHHVATYEWLQKMFGDANVYIATSDPASKEEKGKKINRSENPLDFEEKAMIMTRHGIDPQNIIKADNPYKPVELLSSFDSDSTAAIFVYGAKDAGRLPYTKVDGSPGYFQKYEENEDSLKGFEQHGYVYVAPHVSMGVPGFDEMSGTTIRAALSTGNPEYFKNIMGWYDEDIFNMLKNKLRGLSESKDFDLLSFILDTVEENLDEITVAGNVAGAAGGFTDTVAVRKFNKRQEKDAKLKKKKKKKKKNIDEEMVDTIMDYLVNKGMAQ